MVDHSDIETVCNEYGFPLGGVTEEDDLLKLTPTSLDALPNADDLEALADELEEFGYQFVTFVVPETDG